MCIAKLRKPTINCTTYVGISDAYKDLPVIHAAIYYDSDRRKRRWHSCTPRLGLLRYKGHIWRGNKQIDIVKRFYGTRTPMLGPRLQPSLNGVSVPRAGTHSNWFPDRSWFRGRFKLANRLHLTVMSALSDRPILYAIACQIFMIRCSRLSPMGEPLYTVVSLSNVSYLELLQFNSELSVDEDWSLSIRTSYRGCDNLLTIQTAIDDYLTGTIQISPSPSGDLRADRGYRNFSCVRSTSERRSLQFYETLFLHREIRTALNESTNEFSHTRWFYWRTSEQSERSASWCEQKLFCLANWKKKDFTVGLSFRTTGSPGPRDMCSTLSITDLLKINDLLFNSRLAISRYEFDQ